MTDKAPEKVAQHVVTSENREAFMAKKLDLAPVENKLAEVSQATEKKAEEVKPDVDEKKDEAFEKPKAEEKRPKLGIQERFGELTSQRDVARAETKVERDKREALERQVNELQAKLNPPKDDGKPNQADPKYKDNWTIYVEDLADWKTKQALAERDQKEVEARNKSEADKVMKHWQERQNSFKAETEDYDESIASSSVVVSNEIRDAIIESDLGPQILYHLAKNPDVAEKVTSMSNRGALRELGKLEAKLENASKKDNEPKEESAKAESKRDIVPSKAPAPITPLKGANNPHEVPIDSGGNFKGNFQEYKALRKAGKIK